MKAIQKIVMYTTTGCPDCRMAKAFLRARNIPFEEVNIEEAPSAAELVMRVTGGKRQVPTLDIDGRYVTCSPFRPKILMKALGLES